MENQKIGQDRPGRVQDITQRVFLDPSQIASIIIFKHDQLVCSPGHSLLLVSQLWVPSHLLTVSNLQLASPAAYKASW